MCEKVISWDIGIKNLSYCILKKELDNKYDETYPSTKHNYSIIDWEVINLYPDECKVYKCIGLTKKNIVCNKNAKYYKDTDYYCKKHIIDNCKEIKIKKSKKKKPFEYAMRIKKELDKRPHLSDVDYVLIENQPALVNPIMKTVQIIILSYFSFKNNINNPLIVKNINAKCKEKLPLKDPDWLDSEYYKEYIDRIKKIKSKYTKRKLLCFYYAKMCLETSIEMKNFLLTHKKKDDLTDSFLMCTEWFLR